MYLRDLDLCEYWGEYIILSIRHVACACLDVFLHRLSNELNILYGTKSIAEELFKFVEVRTSKKLKLI